MGVQAMSSHGAGQGSSLYSLTLTEVESHLGEPLRSMNLDDLLRTVLPVSPSAAAKKTVDEVWRDIQSATAGRHPTMGEMTLEDFLSRAGVAVDAAPPWLHHHPPARPLPPPLGLGVYRDPHGDFLSSQVAGRKRAAGEGVGERTVERRQKRMIKNRESAARSRARKQAYTNELENKIALLEEENKCLRKLKMVEPLDPSPEDDRRPVQQPEAKQQQQLRRINSANF